MSQFALAVEQYEKFKELRPEDVKMLKEWADLQPHLPKMTGNAQFRGEMRFYGRFEGLASGDCESEPLRCLIACNAGRADRAGNFIGAFL